MFKTEIFDITDSNEINIGQEIKIIGKATHGIDESQIKQLKDISNFIKTIYKTNVVVINLLELTKWDSLPINIILESVLKEGINKHLIEKGKNPVSIIGKRNTDVYLAARDKYPEENDTELLPWFETLEDFTKAVEH